MNIKKVSFGSKPSVKTEMADSWVDQRIINDSMKRLTVDIPLRLHTALKMDCASRGVKIADEVRELLISRYGNKE
jgi:hypothetical protein